MNKNVIALAVAAAMAAPLAAQAEVKVSGQLQAEVASISGDSVADGLYLTDAQEGGAPGKGNFGALNFSASEDLGNGMKAIAKYGMNISVDGRPITQRDAYVGLSGNFGTVLAGTLSSPYKMATVKWDPFLATSAQARGNGGMSGWHNSYLGNALAYANKFGMAKVVVALVLDEASDTGATPANSSTTGNHAKSFSVNMPVGPVELAIAYIDASDLGAATGAASATNTGVKIGVKYTAGAIGVAGQHETLDTGATDNTTITYLNGTYTMGANTFAAAYGATDTGTTKPTYMSVGMVHGFSKKVSAHVAYIAMDTDNAAGDTNSGMAAGLRVKF